MLSSPPLLSYPSALCLKAEPSIPLLTSSTVTALCAFFTFSYVGSIYLARAGRLAFHAPSIDVRNGAERVRVANEKWRNDPEVIRARLNAVTISTVGSCLVIAFVLQRIGECNDLVTSLQHTLDILGLGWSLPTLRTLKPFLLAPILYIGPLYVEILELRGPYRMKWTLKRDVVDHFFSWQGIRNFIVAPITEEFVFRSCVISVLVLGGSSLRRMVFVSPLWFGIAHAHHAWELYNIYGRTKQAVQRAVITSLVQLTYTTLFGWFCAFLFLRTGSIYPVIFSHIFCNVMGLPAPMYATSRFQSRATVIWVAYVVGIIGFASALGPWSRGA
ncbi:hypothetical protein FRB96_008078 [Tulasnella sp. 330]|nr:hypothetical protein FRB96_008078 [Tulasnella sp. 330]KAG8876621.1 hypothetical protein FRB97_004063 [Tulasnella sp. 331]KAG8878497.1 hypothetical protein FRB98_006106 [Tulasnella sp. 332]